MTVYKMTRIGRECLNSRLAGTLSLSLQQISHTHNTAFDAGGGTMRNTLLSMMTGGIFDGFLAPDEVSKIPERPSKVPSVVKKETRGQKRALEGSIAGSRTPMLKVDNATVDVESRAPKRRRGELCAIPVRMPTMDPSNPQIASDFLRMLPEEVVGHVVSFVGSMESRFALQTCCTQLRRISNTDHMLVNIKLGGDLENGKNGIITEEDTPETAADALTPFARAGNLEAIYMLGMIKSYCHQDIERGIFLLKLASKRGCARSSYTLGLILRDTDPEEATIQMNIAASKEYLPALQELLPAREMKAKYGEPDAAALRNHLDPYCLNRLLGRHYIHSSHLRHVSTSHCWNPLCGRWAYKSTSRTTDRVATRPRRPLAFAFFNNHHVYDHGPDDGVAGLPPRADGESPTAGRTVHRVNRHGSGTPIQPTDQPNGEGHLDVRVSRMKMCSRCCRAKYCSKLCQVYDWRSGRHKNECQYL